jgi:hypothetical protein
MNARRYESSAYVYGGSVMACSFWASMRIGPIDTPFEKLIDWIIGSNNEPITSG